MRRCSAAVTTGLLKGERDEERGRREMERERVGRAITHQQIRIQKHF